MSAEPRSAARQADAALACFGLSLLAMCADSWWVPNPVATDLAAVIFIPLALTFLWSLLMLANLAPCAYATVKAAVSTAKPGRIKRALWCRWFHRYRWRRGEKPASVTSCADGQSLRFSAGPGRSCCDACAGRNYGRAYRRWLAS